MKIEKTARCGKAFLPVLLLALLAPPAVPLQAVPLQAVPLPAVLAQAGSGGHPGARGVALSDAMTAVRGAIWATEANPALGAGLGRSASVFASPAPFGLTDLATAAAVYNELFSFGTVSVAMRTEGFSLYREIEAGATFARSVGESFHVGATISYTALTIERYGSSGTIGINAGVAADVLPALSLGAAVTNINEPRRGAGIRERVPMVLSAGLAAIPSDEVLICADAMKDGAFPVALRLGIEYAPLPLLALRMGTGTEPGTFSCGIGIRHSFLEVDYAFRTHPDLGGTHALSVGIVLSQTGGEER